MNIIQLLFYFLIIIPSSIVHEYAHGLVADKLGDPTARHAGRLTLNPLAHIDIYGTILLPLFLLFVSGGNFMFAYAKPVPYNPYNLSSRRFGPAMVALAGPASNLILAIIFSLLIKILSFTFLSAAFFQLLSIIVFANVLLAIFNLVPIPPLDGSKILFALLPASTRHFQAQLERSGFIILIIFLFFGFQILTPIVYWVYHLLLSV
ncbi:MAG: site-2 protease family protein [Patescibacteria group bacterium]|nr:site-2 protease family protein [Patescibacteria group bacterium]